MKLILTFFIIEKLTQLSVIKEKEIHSLYVSKEKTITLFCVKLLTNTIKYQNLTYDTYLRKSILKVSFRR